MDFIDAQMIGPRRKRDTQDRERLAEIAHRKSCAKHKGRNHWRNWERRRMAAEARKAALIAAASRSAKLSRYTEEVRAYWHGERSDMPGKPA
ncbi:MAG TPA: hypothetical protein VIO94_16070 [Phenylobacterium sp.]